jgi:hypothetical protein
MVPECLNSVAIQILKLSNDEGNSEAITNAAQQIRILDYLEIKYAQLSPDNRGITLTVDTRVFFDRDLFREDNKDPRFCDKVLQMKFLRLKQMEMLPDEF